MKLMAAIVLLSILGLAAGYTEIQGEDKTDQSKASNGELVKISYRSPMGGYMDPSQYSSPPVKFVPPTPSPSTPPETYEEGVSFGELLPIVRDSSISFSMYSDVQGNGGFRKYKTAYDVMGLVSKETSSAINGDLTSSELMLFESLAGEYYLDETQSGNCTKIFLNGTVPTIIFSQSYSWFLGNSYREMNSYKNDGDLIRDGYTAGAIVKNATYFSGLDDIYIFANLTSDELSKITYINSSTVYVLDTRFVGVSSFELDSPMRDLYISNDYIGEIALDRQITLEHYFSYYEEDEGELDCCH